MGNNMETTTVYRADMGIKEKKNGKYYILKGLGFGTWACAIQGLGVSAYVSLSTGFCGLGLFPQGFGLYRWLSV